MCRKVVVGFIVAALLVIGIVTVSSGQAWDIYLDDYLARSSQEQAQMWSGLDSQEREYLLQTLGDRGFQTITAGEPTELTYTVTARNLSGVPVANPVITDNGRVLNNDEAVKTGGNQDNILEVGETWTWTYRETVTGVAGQVFRNTATIQGPDDPNRDTDPTNNTASTGVIATEPPGLYDLEITKTVAVPHEIPIEDIREETLDECNVWKAAQSGGFGGTQDTWDISAMPVGTVFDLKYNAFSVPDRYVVEYPIGVRVHDTGWRGVQSYIDRNPQLYPGGLSGPGQGQEDGVFVKGQANQFRVIVYGPEQGTAWNYEIRGNCP